MFLTVMTLKLNNMTPDRFGAYTDLLVSLSAKASCQGTAYPDDTATAAITFHGAADETAELVASVQTWAFLAEADLTVATV